MTVSRFRVVVSETVETTYELSIETPQDAERVALGWHKAEPQYGIVHKAQEVNVVRIPDEFGRMS